MRKKKQEKTYGDRVNRNRDFITLTHGYAKPLYVSGKRKDEDKAIRELGAARAVVGILACALLLLGGYWAFVNVVFPSFQKPSAPSDTVSKAVETVKEVVPQDMLVSYDSATGLPVYEDAFNLFVINSSNPVPETFEVPVEEYAGIEVDKRILPALRMLVTEAGKAGVTLEFSGGIVSFEEQEKLYNAKVEELVQKGSTKIMARAEAKKYVAYPGEADAQTGMSVALKAEEQKFAESDTYHWLSKYAAEYGFVFRFPEGKTQYTGTDADYRILRYVGKENALKMRQLSMCLEEYVSYTSKTTG